MSCGGERQSTRRLLTSLTSCRTLSGYPKYVFKYVIVGDASVGKTHLIHQYINTDAVSKSSFLCNQ